MINDDEVRTRVLKLLQLQERETEKYESVELAQEVSFDSFIII